MIEFIISAFVLTATANAAPNIPVPSGAPTYLFETLHDTVTEPHSLRFRYVQQSLSQDSDFAIVADDLFALCQNHAAPNLGKNGADVGQIIVSIADRETIFGETRPDVTQIFEVFSIEDGQCAWAEVLE